MDGNLGVMDGMSHMCGDCVTPPEPPPTWSSDTPEPILFSRLSRAFFESLERGDEKETRAVLGKMRTLCAQSPGLVPAAVIGEYEQRIEKQRIRIRQVTDEIARLAERAVSASREGDEQNLARAMRRLSAIHAAHPLLLDEPGMEDVRSDVAHAADERLEHQLTTKKLLSRERAITAEIKALAAAVRDFHHVACTTLEASEEFRKAEATYIRTIKKVHTYDSEWFSGVVLELADVLAEWAEPPPGAKRQIRRFLDGISAGLDTIRAKMREIEDGRDSAGESEPAGP